MKRQKGMWSPFVWAGVMVFMALFITIMYGAQVWGQELEDPVVTIGPDILYSPSDTYTATDNFDYDFDTNIVIILPTFEHTVDFEDLADGT